MIGFMSKEICSTCSEFRCVCCWSDDCFVFRFFGLLSVFQFPPFPADQASNNTLSNKKGKQSTAQQSRSDTKECLFAMQKDCHHLKLKIYLFTIEINVRYLIWNSNCSFCTLTFNTITVTLTVRVKKCQIN